MRVRPTCSVDGCDKPNHSRGYCNGHKMRLARHGDPTAGQVFYTGCLVEDCNREHESRGYCKTHYRRLSSTGSTEDPRSTLRKAVEAGDGPGIVAELLVFTTEGPNGCREWSRSIDTKGYARVPIAGKTHGAHRVMAEAVYGPLHGEPVHHVCANRKCIEPTHLQPVTQRENVAEMLTRRWLESRIEALEQALSQVAPTHPLLAGLVA